MESMSRFGNSLTERTSTKSVLRFKRWTGRAPKTASIDRIDVAKTTTSGCSSQKSLMSLKNDTPILSASTL